MRKETRSPRSCALRTLLMDHIEKKEIEIKLGAPRSHEQESYHAQPVKLTEQRLITVGHIF